MLIFLSVLTWSTDSLSLETADLSSADRASLFTSVSEPFTIRSSIRTYFSFGGSTTTTGFTGAGWDTGAAIGIVEPPAAGVKVEALTLSIIALANGFEAAAAVAVGLNSRTVVDIDMGTLLMTLLRAWPATKLGC